MPNGFLNISHNFAGETNFIVVEWVKSTAQGTPVVGHVTGTGLGLQNDTDATFVSYPAPHVNEQLQVINLSLQWHLVRFWRSSDGIAKDVLLLELAGNARTGALFPIERYEYVVDRGESDPGVWADPQDGDIGIRDTRLFEKSFWVEERGLGSLLEAEITVRDDEGGGFDFSAAQVALGKQMFTGGVYVVYAVNRVELEGDSGDILTDNDDIFVLDSDQEFDPVTMGGRNIVCDFSTTVGTLSFANLGSHPDSSFKLTTHAGLQRNVVLQLDVGDTVNFRKVAVNKITLGQGECIEVVIKDNVMYVKDSTTNHENLGVVKWSYNDLLNGLKADGSSLAIADYPRVAELIAALPAGAVVSEVTWQTQFAFPDGQSIYINKGKWMYEGGANFRPPDLRNRMLKAGSSLAVTSGVYQHDAVKAHDHEMRGGFGFGGYDGGGNVFWRIRNLTDPFVADDIMATTGEVDNMVKNIQLYPIICI